MCTNEKPFLLCHNCTRNHHLHQTEFELTPRRKSILAGENSDGAHLSEDLREKKRLHRRSLVEGKRLPTNKNADEVSSDSEEAAVVIDSEVEIDV